MAELPQAGRILLVDDDPMIVRLVQKILAKQGFPPLMHALTGREALELLDEEIAVVLLDHQLPDTTGLEVLDAIRARPNPPSVVMITAHGNESLAAGALRRGAEDYLAKDASLAEMLPQVLERVRRTRELRKALAASERDLLRAERMAAIGEMTVTLHHEINNPLMAATADVQLLLADPAMSEEQKRQALQGIDTSLRRIRDIVRQIGDLRAARSKDYLPGVRMLDLNGAAPAETTPHRGIALLYIAEEDLARVVTLLLRHAGFAVERSGSPGELQKAAGRLGVTLVLVVGGGAAAGTHPLGGFTPSGTRDYRLVALVAAEGGAATAAGADRVIQLPFDPGSFTAEMIALVG